MVDAGTALGGAGTRGRGAAGSGAQPPGDADASLLHDAGRAIMDTAGDMMADAGGVLIDAGSRLEDAGSAVDGESKDAFDDGVVAQTTCGACTAGMRAMVVTADQDLQQLRGGNTTGTDWSVARSTTTFQLQLCSGQIENRLHYAKLVDGPFLLTDFNFAGSNFQLFTVPAGQACVVDGAPITSAVNCPVGPDGGQVPSLVRSPQARPVFTGQNGFMLAGARLLIAAGQSLCVIPNTTTTTELTTTPDNGASERVLWSGFVPYE